MKKKLIVVLLTLCFCVAGCDYDSTTTPTYVMKPVKEEIDVTISVKYKETFGLVADAICDVYIDNEKLYSAQAADSTITISAELKKGKHDIRIKTEDWGLVTGRRSNEIEFEVSQTNKNFSFTYECPTLGELKLWNNATSN